MGDVHGVGGPSRRLLMFRAARIAVRLSLLFVIVYGATNWFTAQRPESQVRTWYFAWELTSIPYVPWLVVPYVSIDLLFFLAPFLCRDDQERRLLAWRVAFSILVAAITFLVLPLKLAWPPRPHVEGWFGDFVEWSSTAPFLMEYPHNLFPAMHVTLCLILAEFYGRHTHGLVRVLSGVWFVLIALSTVLTWQHHLVDVAGGIVLAAFAFYLFREPGPSFPVLPNVRIGCFYTVGATMVLALVPATWPWGVFLLWPAAALGIVAAAYFALGPRIFRKTNGRLPLSTRFVLGPMLVGQYLSLVYYRCRCRAWDQVSPGVLVGCVLTRAEARALIQQGVTAVVDLTAEFSESAPLRATRYLNLPILDLTAPTQEQLRQAAAFIEAEAATGCVYVHCKIGYSRSAAVVGAYLLTRQPGIEVTAVVDRLRKVRPTIVVRPEAMKALHLFARGEKSGRSSQPGARVREDVSCAE